MESTRRQPEEPQQRPQRDTPAGPIDSVQDPHLGAAVREPLARQREPRGPQQGQHELQQRGELLDASPELQDLVLEFQLAQVCHVEADDDLGCPAEPPTGRRARNAESRRDGHVPGAVDEIAEPVVIALLRAGLGRHGADHRPFARPAQLLKEASAAVRDDPTTP